MNQVFKVVRCLSTGVFKAVPEFAKSGKKSKSIAISASILSAGIAIASPAFADTTVGDPVVAGYAEGTNAIAVGETSRAIGENALAVGANVSATADDATAIGTDSRANGDDSVAIGKSNSATATNSTAIGSLNTAEGYQTTTVGYENSVVGMSGRTTAIGASNKANVAHSSTAIGFENDIEQVSNVTALGQRNIIKAPMGWDERPAFGLQFSTAVGFGNNVAGSYSTVSGFENYTENGGTTVTGRENYVKSMNGGAYGGNNSVRGSFGGMPPEVASSMTRIDDGFSSISEASYNQPIRLGESYAYGNGNFVEADQTHAVGNRNEAISNMSGVFGNGNTVTFPNNGFDGGDGGWFPEPTEGPFVNDDIRVPAEMGIREFTYPSLNFRESTGNFVIGNANEVEADNTHTLGNANDIRNSKNVTIGNSNTVNFYDSSNGGGVVAFDAIGMNQNTSTAIVGDTNTLTAAGGHIFGTENAVSQENTYVVGGNNRVLQTADGLPLPLGASGPGTNVLGSDNRSESVGTSILGDYNRIASGSTATIVSGYQNNSQGDFSSVVGNFNMVEKDAGGTHGMANQVFGVNRVQQAIAEYFSNQEATIGGIDIDGDGTIDYDSPEQALLAAVEGGSYTYGNLNGVDGEAVHVVGNKNVIAGDRSGSFGNNNQIGASEKIMDITGGATEPPVDSYPPMFINSDGMVVDGEGFSVNNMSVSRSLNGDRIVLDRNGKVMEGWYVNSDGMVMPPETGMDTGLNAVKYDDTFVYGNDNVVDAQKTNVVGTANTVNGKDSGVFGNDNSVDGLTNYVTGDGNDVIGDWNTVNGTSNTVEGNDNTTIGISNDSLAADSTVVGNDNRINGKYVFVGGVHNNVFGYESGALGDGNIIGDEELRNTAAGSYALGNYNNIQSEQSFVIGNNSAAGESALGSLIIGSDTIATQKNSVLLGNTTTDKAATTIASTTIGGMTFDNYAGASDIDNGIVSVGSSGAERQIINVGSGEVSANSTDAINGSQLYSVASSLDRVADSVADSFGGNATQADDGTITYTDIGGTGQDTLDDAIAVANNGVKSVTGDDNITATTDDKNNVAVALNKDLNVDNVTTGATSFNTNGVRAGDVFLSSTTGLDNAGNRVTNVGDAIERSDAVNFGQVSDIDDRLTAENVAQNTLITTNTTNITRNTTTIGNVGDSVVSSFGGNATQADDGTITYTDIGGTGQDTLDDAIAVANNGVKSVTGDDNITATTDDKNNVAVALNKDLNVDNVTTGATSFNTNGVRAGDVFLSSTTGLDNAGNRVTNVGDAIERSDAVNFGQFTDGLNGLTKTTVDGDQNVIATKNTTGYDLSLSKNLVSDTLTTGATSVSTNGIKAGEVSLSSTTGLDNAGNRVTRVGDAVESTDAVNLGQVSAIDDRLTRENVIQTNNITNNISNIAFNTQMINKGFSIGDGKTSTNYNLGDTVNITSGRNTVTTNTSTGVEVSLANDITVNTVSTGVTSMTNNGLSAGSVVVNANSGLNNAGFTVSGVGNAVNKDDAVNLGQFKEALSNIQVEGIATQVSGDQNIVATTNGNNVSLSLAKDVKVNSVQAGDVVLSSTSGLNNAGFTVSGVGNAVNKDDAVNLGQLDAVDKRLTDKNAAQDIIINSKADTTYVDAKNAAQDKVISTKLDIKDFEASQQAQNEKLKIETDRLDAADKDLQAQVDNKVDTTVFEADQARQDADLKKVSDDSQAADKDLQAQVDNKVDTTVFEADQARQDALIDTKADKDFIQSTISTESARYDNMLKDMSADNSQRLSEIVDQQSMVDLAQDARIDDNSSRISDLGYKVDEMDDMFSSAIASTVAFASMPAALNPGETRISGGSGYYNGAGAIAVGLTGSNEDGAYNYKIGSSYTQKGGVVVGAGVSMRVW
ncbi:ESPR-type extended signal peptide-containing protein [Psychrobacter celer]|uniref:ESPR-type extended signal peptide-containing protein n=1 Tax=Psychrobacter celer TaxID=306572 RepID=UPI003FD504AA